ncbi:flavin-containing monooxygenase [Phreatobacter sp.]|uniref:flavin-containing monooxygenase n=1 Tax=Phreatobacter sp. TaxID=1966341 RepID=UPI003F6ED1B7
MADDKPLASDRASICIIGAGSSGVAVAKALKERGLAFDCFEKGSDIGGMWRYENDNGLSSAYQCLHIDTSRDNLGYSDFPIAADQPDYLSHTAFLKHLEAYADQFGIRPLVTFRTSVERVEPDGEGGWAVTLDTGEVRRYAQVIVANGHLWDPRWPDFPGAFAGEQIHSHHYRTPAPFEDRDVLVVGLGNSAVDIAVDLSRRARSVTVSTRRGAWLMPKYIMGIPTDRWSAFLSRRIGLPTRITRTIMARLGRIALGDQRRFGLPRPSHPIWREHATLSQDLLNAIGHGRITVKGNVARLDGEDVTFADGSRRRFDAIIHATGYRTSFPFLDPALFRADRAPVRLYRRLQPPALPDLFFPGLVQPIGPTIPLVELQAKWIAGVISGHVQPADAATMEREIDAHLAYVRDTFLDSDRYVLEVDFKAYAGQIRADLAAGRCGA